MSGNPKGRPTRGRENEYMGVLWETCPVDVWKTICRSAVMDALGLRVEKVKEKGKGGKIIDRVVPDDTSDANTRQRAREWLGNYLQGRPITPVLVSQTGGNIMEIFQGLGNAELLEIERLGMAVLDEMRKMKDEGSNGESGDAIEDADFDEVD